MKYTCPACNEKLRLASISYYTTRLVCPDPKCREKYIVIHDDEKKSVAEEVVAALPTKRTTLDVLTEELICDQ